MLSKLSDYLGDALFVCKWLCYVLVKWTGRVRERDDDLWVFGARGGEAFTDNAKYLFLHVTAHHPEVRAVWLSKDRAVVAELQAAGYEAYHAYSPRGMALNLRAGVVCLTQGLGDVNLPCSAGATTVSLWHGVPLKTIAWDAEFSQLSRPVRWVHDYFADEIDLLALPSDDDELAAVFASALRIDRDRMVATGYPRNDALVDGPPEGRFGTGSAAAEAVADLAREGPVALYLPTYRRATDASLDDALDFEALDAVLAAHDATLVVKTHPMHSVDVAGADAERVRSLPADGDPYPVLALADVLVTDYSSVYFDYLHRDRPVVFYPFDLAEYRDGRGFSFEYDAVTPGRVARDPAGLAEALDRALANARAVRANGGVEPDEFAAERAAVRDRFVCTDERSRSAAVYDAIRETLDTE